MIKLQFVKENLTYRFNKSEWGQTFDEWGMFILRNSQNSGNLVNKKI